MTNKLLCTKYKLIDDYMTGKCIFYKYLDSNVKRKKKQKKKKNSSWPKTCLGPERLCQFLESDPFSGEVATDQDRFHCKPALIYSVHFLYPFLFSFVKGSICVFVAYQCSFGPHNPLSPQLSKKRGLP